MLTYDYRCEGCDNVFSKSMSITSSKETTCPHCETITSNRLISGGGGFILRGGGWASDLYTKPPRGPTE